MQWTDQVEEAIEYIEEHITEDLSVVKIASFVNISSFYFQKGFSLLCGFSVSEYVRKRRLALAGGELISSDVRVLDLAYKYGYDSVDSFTKAFSRFHGASPSMARKDGALLKSFAPLKIKLILEGGYSMDYKITKKDSFTVLAAVKNFTYEEAKAEIPKFWQEHYAKGNGKYVCGMYGISHDEKMTGDTFEYLLADDYKPTNEIPEGFVTEVIPAFTWAVFPCKGAMPKALQETNKKIYSEWLPENKEYEIAAGYCVEMYDDPTAYPKGTQDENYYCEMWIPVVSVAR